MSFECRTGHIDCTKCKLSKNQDTANICYTFNKWDYLQGLETIFWELPKFNEYLKNATIVEVQYDEPRAWKTQYNNGKYTILINTSQLRKEAKELGRNYKEYFYETLFHEYTHTLSMNNQRLKKDYSDENIRGFTLLFEYFAQKIAQKIISHRYKKKYPEKKCKLEFEGKILNENSSDLFWYGEIEPFALKFSELLYWTKDWEKMINDYSNGNIYNLIKEKIQQNPEFIKHLNNLGIIIAWNYIQQWYIKGEEYKNRVNKKSYKKAICSLQD